MRVVGGGVFALALLADFAEATGALATLVFFSVVALLAAALLVNLPALVLEVLAEGPAFLVEVFVKVAFEEEEEGFPVAGLTSAAGFEARFTVVDSAAVERAFADLALAFAPLVETGTFVF